MKWPLSRRETLLIYSAGLLVVPSVAAVFYVANQPPALAQHHKALIPFDSSAYDAQQVVNAFPPIVHPPHVAAEQANEVLQPSELVLGVEINGEARAYPINMLTGPSREIFNDQLGGESIAATW